MGMSLTCAVEEARLGEDDEGARVARQNAAEEDVTQLPAGRHDDGGPEQREWMISRAEKDNIDPQMSQWYHFCHECFAWANMRM